MIEEPPPTDTSESGAKTSARVASVFSSAGMGRIPWQGEEIGDRDAHRCEQQDGRHHREVQHADKDEHGPDHGRVAGIAPSPQPGLYSYAEQISAGCKAHR